MSTKTQTELNQAQACIYSKSNIARAYPDIEAMSITDIQKDGDQIVINGDTRLDAKPVQEAFTEFTNRVPHFFEYLSPTGGALTPWRDKLLRVMERMELYISTAKESNRIAKLLH